MVAPPLGDYFHNLRINTTYTPCSAPSLDMKNLLLFTLLLLPFFAFAQLSGTVRDENGEPLPFASVYVRGSTNGTVANGEGQYKLALTRGAYEVVFQYLGYKQHIESVTIGDKPLRLEVRMESSNLELGMVTITTDDPAVRMMREVIAKRRYYNSKVPDYTTDVYIKGFVKMLDAPKKIMGKEIGNMGGVLDTNQQGVLYLSESVSKVYTQGGKKKEVMVSSKVSGESNGFSINRSTLTNFNLYDEHINIDRDILSPLADNAFNYYTFKFLGRFKDENGYDICKIKVIPKRSADPTFSGYLLVVDEQWNLAGLDLALTGDAIKQPVLDTLRIRQEFVPVEKPDTWCMFSQLTQYEFAVLGFKFTGFFNGVFSNYDIHPKFEEKFFNKEVFKIETTASERDSTYWKTIRPVPLTQEESSDYVRKDSLKIIWKSDAYRDSMDRKANKFGVMDLLTGYTWRNTKHRTSVGYPSAARWIQFNTIQGFLLNVNPEFTRYSDEDRIRYWIVEGNMNYGFAETKLRSSLRVRRRLEGTLYRTAELSGGLATEQFNPREPIGPMINGAYTLYLKRNYLRIYEKLFARAEWSQYVVPGLWLRADAEWARRNPLINHSNYSPRKKLDRDYTPNAPLTGGTEPAFASNEIFALSLLARIRIGERYSSYPKFRSYESSEWPELTLIYRKAIPGVAGSDVDFDYVQAQIRKNDLNLGLAGYSNFQVVVGAFLRDQRLEFMDLRHASGNQTIFGKPDTYERSFFLLPYYDYSTNRPFTEIHWQHHLQGWLLDKVPGLRKLNWKEVIGANFYYTDRTVSEGLLPEKLPYWEVNFGFENIGFKVFRPFRIDVAAGFFGTQYYRTGVVVGMDL